MKIGGLIVAPTPLKAFNFNIFGENPEFDEYSEKLRTFLE